MVRLITILLFLQFALIPFAYAGPPVINNNVTIFQHANPGQCPSSVKMRGGNYDVTDFSGLGEQDTDSAPGVRSCTGCAIDQAGDCVCKTCYDYFDDF